MNIPRTRTIAAALLAAAAALTVGACGKIMPAGNAFAAGASASPSGHHRHHGRHGRHASPAASTSPAASSSPSDAYGSPPDDLTARETRFAEAVRSALHSAGYESHVTNAEIGSAGHGVCIARIDGFSQSQVTAGTRLANTQAMFRMAPAAFARDAEQAICPSELPGGTS